MTGGCRCSVGADSPWREKKTSSVNITSGEAALKKVIENVVDQPN